MYFLTRMLNRPKDKDSAGVAKQRLQLMLAQDRMSISPETLNELKDGIITAISQHIEIDRANVQVTLTHTNQGECLTANIPVLGVRAPVLRLAKGKRVRPRRPHAARA